MISKFLFFSAKMRPSIVSLGKHFGNLGKVSCFSFAPLFFEIIICFHCIIILDVWRASLRLGPQRAESIQGIFWAGRRKRTFFRFITLKVWVGFLDIVLIGQAAIRLFRFDLFIYIFGCIPRIFFIYFKPILCSGVQNIVLESVVLLPSPSCCSLSRLRLGQED